MSVYWLVLFLVSRQPAGADTVGYAFGMFFLALATSLCEIAALGLGVAGALQRRRRRRLALVGVACSVVVLAVIHAQVELGYLAAGAVELFTEPQPKVHYVSPGNE